MAIKDRSRLQIYAHHVQKLEANDYMDEKRITEYPTLGDMELPRLKRIDVPYYEPGDDVDLCVKCCIRPSLEESALLGL